MAKTVYTPEEVTLQDGKKVVLRPLVISKLKEAMAYWDNAGETPPGSVEDDLDFLLGLARICLSGQIEEDYVLEDTLDPVTAKRAIKIGTGIDLDAQNLALAAAMAAAAEQSGQTLTS